MDTKNILSKLNLLLMLAVGKLSLSLKYTKKDVVFYNISACFSILWLPKRDDLHLQCWLLNQKDSNSHDSKLLNRLITLHLLLPLLFVCVTYETYRKKLTNISIYFGFYFQQKVSDVFKQLDSVFLVNLIQAGVKSTFVWDYFQWRNNIWLMLW